MQEMELEKAMPLLNKESNEEIDNQHERKSNQLLKDKLIFDDSIKNISEEDKESNENEEDSCKAKTKSVLYNIKDYMFPFILLASCCPNFSYLNIVFVLLGLLHPFLLLFVFSNMKKFKMTVETSVLVYSILCLIFKITIISLKIDWTNDQKEILLNLGIAAIKDMKNANLYIVTFIGDTCVFSISLLSMLITLCCCPTVNERQRIISPIKLDKYLNFLLWLLVINCIFYTSCNLSYCSIAIAFFIHIAMFMWAIKDKLKSFFYFWLFSTILIVFVYQIIMTHLMNIKQFLFFFDDDLKYFLSYTGVLQINGEVQKSPQEQIPPYIKASINYVFISSGIILVFIAFKVLNLPVSLFNDDNYRKNINKEVDNKKKPNIFFVLLKKFREYLISPYFIMHFCRIGLIFWVYYFRNFESVILLLWVCISFLLLKTEKIFFVSEYIMYLGLSLVGYLFQWTNIPYAYQVSQDITQRIINEHYGLYIYKYEIIENIFIQIIILIFALLIKAIVESKKPKLKQIEEGEDLSLLVEKEEQDDLFVDEDIDQKAKDFSFSTLIIKFFIGNIDKITLVIMYFIAIGKVNILHLLLTIIFMIQLLTPNVIIKICYVIMIFIELTFSCEYAFELAKVYFDKDDTNLFNLIKVFIEFSQDTNTNSLEFLLFLAVYCFYVQYQNYNYALYKNIVLKSNYTFEGYLKEKFKNYPLVLSFFMGLINIILEFYVWILIIFCFFFNCYFEINLLFNIKFALFLILCFQFLSSIQTNGKKKYNTCYHWIFMIYCMFNTMIVYFYQFGELDFLKKTFNDAIILLFPNEVLRENLPVIGVQVYDIPKLAIKFLPHFAMNFLSVLFYWEIQRITKNLSDKLASNNLIKHFGGDGSKAPLALLISEPKNQIKTKAIIKSKDKLIEDEYKEIEAKDKGKKDEGLDEEAIKRSNKRTIFLLKFQYIVFEAIALFAKIYWLLLFLSIFIIYTIYSLSLSMIIYLSIFGISFSLMYRRSLKSVVSFLKKETFFISKLIRHNLIEIPNHIRTLKWHRKMAFRSLLSFSIFYIILTYLYAVFDITQNGCLSPRWDCNVTYHSIISEELEDYFQAVGYICGVYVNVRKVSFFNSIWVHIFLIVVVSLDVYILKIQSYVSKKALEISRLLKKIQFEIEAENSDIKRSFLHKESINKLNESVDSGRRSFGESFSIRKKIKTESEVVNDFLGIFKNIKHRKGRLNLKEKNHKYKFLKMIKAVLEEVIILMLILTSISKLSIWSFIYMGIVLYLFLVPKRTLMTFYCLLNVLIISIFIQAGFFLSNISMEIAPNPDKLCLILILKNLRMPWFSSLINDAWGFFLGMGVNKIQTSRLWLDFIEVVLICVYLDMFSYSIYQEVPNRGNILNKTCKISYNNLSSKQSLRTIVHHLSDEEYQSIKNNFFDTFGIQLCSYEEIQKCFEFKKMDKGDLQNALISLIKPMQKSKSDKTLGSMTKLFFLSMHNIVLTIIIILSVMVSGLISSIYISFSLIYLLDSTSIIRGTKSNYPKGIKKTLRNYIIIDIIIQLIIQMPINTYFNETLMMILKTIGINQIIHYNDPNDSRFFELDTNELFLVNVKAITYFIMSLQVYIYSSQAFQEFYFNYVLKKNNQIRKRSLINSFLFNNIRIETMNKSINKRIQITKAMNKLEQTLTQWNKQLLNMGKPEFEYNNKEQEEKKENNEEKIKEEIRAEMIHGVLIPFWIWMHRHNTNYTFTDKNEKLEFEMNIIQGKTMTKLPIEKNVDSFIEKLDLSLGKEEIIKEINDYLYNTKKKETHKKNSDHLIEEDQKIEDKNLKHESNSYLYEDDENQKENESEKDKDELIDTRNTAFKQSNKEKEKDIAEEDEDIKIVSPKKQILNKESNNDNGDGSHNNNDLIEKQLEKKQELIEQIHTLLHSTIKKKHYKTGYAIKKILETFLIYFLDSSHNICFIIMIIHHMVNGSLISLFYPISVFGMGLLDYPRPSKLFWNICLLYSTTILIIKFVSQFYIIQTIPFLKETIFGTLTKYKIGLINYQSTFTLEFFLYIFFDALILFFILIQEYILITKGLWDKNEASIESIKEGHERIFKANLNKHIENIKQFNNEYLLQRKDLSNKASRSVSVMSKDSNKQKQKKQPSVSSYVNNLFPKVRNEKPGDNYYIFYTIPLLFIIVYLIAFYTNMEQDKVNGFTNIEDISKNSIKQFSGVMVIFVVIHVIIAVIDRVIYIRQNRNELTFEYVFFDKQTGQLISKKEMNRIKAEIKKQEKSFPKESFEIPIEDLDSLKDNYNIMFIQNESTNWPLITKYILHWATLIFSHILIFFYLPMKGNYNLQTAIYCESKDPLTCNDFTNNVFMIIFYLIYVIYLLFSAFQIKKGLLDLREKSLLKTTFSSINGIIFKTIKAIPFLYELKLSIDWTFTSTCLDLFQWNKFEKIYDVLYTTTCAMRYVDNNPVGNKIGKFMKALMGGVLFIVILLILIVPLFLFSTLNPTNELNKVTGASTSLSIIFEDKDGLNKTYILFENNHVENVFDLEKGGLLWNSNNYSNISQTKNFPKGQIQVVQMSETTDNMWDIATPHKETIITKLNQLVHETDHNIAALSLSYEYSFVRPNPPETKESKKQFEYLIYRKYPNGTIDARKKEIIENLNSGLSNCKHTEMVLEDFYKAGMRLYAIPHPKVILETKWNDVILIFDCNNISKINPSYFSLKQSNKESNNDTQDKDMGMEFHIFSDKVSAATASYSIITFFTTYILLAGMYLGNFFAGEAERVILTEMPDPEKLVNLCEAVQISRYSHQLEKEEHLYYMLIEFMRSPEYLRLLTKASLSKFKERKDRLNKQQETNGNSNGDDNSNYNDNDNDKEEENQEENSKDKKEEGIDEDKAE